MEISFCTQDQSNSVVWCMTLGIFYKMTPRRFLTLQKDKDRRESKGRRCCWGTECIQFIAAKAIFHQDDLKEGINSSYSSHHPGAIHPVIHIALVQLIIFFKLSWCQIASGAKKWVDSAPQATATTFAFSTAFILLLCHHQSWEVVDSRYSRCNGPGSSRICTLLCGSLNIFAKNNWKIVTKTPQNANI